MKNITKIINLILLCSPILVSSLFIYGSSFPAWSNTIMLSIFISSFILIKNTIQIFRDGKVNWVTFYTYVIGLIFAIGFAFYLEPDFYFNFFGKGLTEWSSISVLGLFIAFAYFSRNKNIKLSIILSALPLAYTILNFIFIKYIPGIGSYTAYINIPLIGFGKLINYAFIFSLVCLIGSLLNYFCYKKGVVFLHLKLSKKVKVFLFIFISLFVFTLFNYALRYMAASKYINASNYFSQGKIDEAKKELSKAITIAPYDSYYLARIDIVTQEINTLLQSKATNTEKLQNEYKSLVEYQINDAKKAIEYDNKNPQNYMALGYAYERAMVLTKDGAYEMAISAYENARKLATDKDYVDVVKAKTAFSAEKETEGLGYLDNALRFNSSSSPALYLSSQYYAAKNKLDSAIEYGEKTVGTAPYAADGRMNLGLLYLKTKKYDAAIKEFGNALSITNGRDTTAMYYLAIAYKMKGDAENLSKVITELEKTLDPNSKEMQALKN